MAEIEGVPRCRRCGRSRSGARRCSSYLERHGTSGFYAAKVAALETRDRRSQSTCRGCGEEWRARAAEHGLGRRELKRLLGRSVGHELEGSPSPRSRPSLLGTERTDRAALHVQRARSAVMAWAESHSAGRPR